MNVTLSQFVKGAVSCTGSSGVGCKRRLAAVGMYVDECGARMMIDNVGALQLDVTFDHNVTRSVFLMGF